MQSLIQTLGLNVNSGQDASIDECLLQRGKVTLGYCGVLVCLSISCAVFTEMEKNTSEASLESSKSASQQQSQCQ